MNPKLITAIVDKILAELYRASDNYRLTELTTIIGKNMMLTKTNDKWFGFRGEYYSITTKLPQGRPVLLDRSLRERMKTYLSYCDKIDAEKQLIKSYIVQVAQKIRYKEMILDFLPDNTHHLLNNLLRFFPSLDSQDAKPLNEKEIAAFKKTNHKYLDIMRSRMVVNLIGG